MNLDDFEKGKKIYFKIGNDQVNAVYFGRFDFLYMFDTEFKTLPKVATVYNKSIVIINMKLLAEYQFSTDEVRAILYHEVGHKISSKQDKLKGIDAEYDADEYAVGMIGKELVLSALEKTKKLVAKESTSEERKQNSLSDLEKRIKNIQERNRGTQCH